jgi:hypothetical protein
MKRVLQAHGATHIRINRWVKNRAAQQFIFNGVDKVIRSNYWKNYALEIPSKGSQNELRMTSSINSIWYQMFRVQGAFIVNEGNGKVFDVSGGVDDENRNVITYNKHGGLNQQWDVIYADEYPREPINGELNEDFGLYVGREFYIISDLPEGRYLSLINNRNMVIKTKNGQK